MGRLRFRKKTYYLMMIILLLGIIVSQSGRIIGINFIDNKGGVKETAETQITEQEVYAYFPDADSWEKREVSTFEIFKSNKKIGTILYSAPYTNSILGYQGPVPLLIVLDEEESVRDVVLLGNNESPEYVNLVKESGLFERWNQMKINEAVSMKVDAVSGATYTSQGVIETMAYRLAVYNELEKSSPFNIASILRDVAMLFVLVFAVYAFFRPARMVRGRLVLLILTILVLGIWQGRMLSMTQFISWFLNGIPFGTQWAMVVMLILATALPMLTGKSFYCAYVCPFGAMQDLAGRPVRKKWRLSRTLLSGMLLIKRVILFGGLLVIGLGLAVDFSYIEPFTVFKPYAASWVAIAVAIVSLALSVFIPRPWCRFCCPAGEILEMIRRKNLHEPSGKIVK